MCRLIILRDNFMLCYQAIIMSARKNYKLYSGKKDVDIITFLPDCMISYYDNIYIIEQNIR